MRRTCLTVEFVPKYGDDTRANVIMKSHELVNGQWGDIIGLIDTQTIIDLNNLEEDDKLHILHELLRRATRTVAIHIEQRESERNPAPLEPRVWRVPPS